MKMTNPRFLFRQCPGCSALRPPQASVYTEPRAEDRDFADLVPIWNGFFKKKVIFSYSRCKSCGLLFAPLFFDHGQLEALYAQMPPNMDSVPIDALRRTQRGYFDHLKRTASLTGNFLELGPDIGLFTENCVSDGNFDRFWLFEPNRAVAGALHAVVRGKSHSIVHDTSDFSAIPDKSISCVVMIHVLDHLLEPRKSLDELRAKVVPGAHVLIVTHDESSLLARILGSRWPAYCLQHPQLFDKKSIKKLLNAAGFTVVRQVRSKNYFQISFLVRHLLFALGVCREVGVPLGRFSIGLKLGNILTIASPDAHQ